MTDTTLPAQARDSDVAADLHGMDMSFDDYLKRFNSIEGIRTEWVGGKVQVYPVSNNTVHQELLGFLLHLFSLFLDYRRSGRVLLAGVPMRVGDTAREPDLLIVLNANLNRIQPTYLDGAADAVVEIVSPESDARDHGDKLVDYEAAGVKEYYLVDPLRQAFTLYVLREDGRYDVAPADAEGRVASALLPGFMIDPALLWRDPLPGILEAVALVQAMVEVGEGG